RKLRVDVEPSRELHRDRGDPDDQRRIDLDDVHIELSPGHPAARDIQQPGNVILEGRAEGRKEDQTEDAEEQYHAHRRDHRPKHRICRTHSPDLDLVHVWLSETALRRGQTALSARVVAIPLTLSQVAE